MRRSNSSRDSSNVSIWFPLWYISWDTSFKQDWTNFTFQLHTDLSTYTEPLCYKQKRQTVSKFANSKLVKQGWSCREYHLLRSNPSVTKGCLSASCAVMRFAGSYLSSPCKRSMKSPADWSTFCITRFCSCNIEISFTTDKMGASANEQIQYLESGQFHHSFHALPRSTTLRPIQTSFSDVFLRVATTNKD